LQAELIGEFQYFFGKTARHQVVSNPGGQGSTCL
jgi:hypothetical protein